MKEVFLYRCQICKLLVCGDEDKGSIWYIVSCAGCSIGQFYERVVIKPAYDMFGVFQGNRFTLEEKKDEHSNTRTDQEKSFTQL